MNQNKKNALTDKLKELGLESKDRSLLRNNVISETGYKPASWYNWTTNGTPIPLNVKLAIVENINKLFHIDIKIAQLFNS